MGDRNEPALKGQTAVSIMSTMLRSAKDMPIYIFWKLDLLDINFLSRVVFYTKKLLERKRTKIQTNIELKMVNN